MNLEGDMRRKVTLLDVVIVVSIAMGFVVIMIILNPRAFFSRNEARKAGSISNAAHVARAMLLYAEEWEDHLPPGSHWEDRIAKKLSSKDLVQLNVPRDQPPHRLALNASMDRLDLNTIDSPEKTVLLFETASLGKSSVGGIDIAAPFLDTKKVIVAYANGRGGSIPKDKIRSLIWTPILNSRAKKER